MSSPFLQLAIAPPSVQLSSVVLATGVAVSQELSRHRSPAPRWPASFSSAAEAGRVVVSSGSRQFDVVVSSLLGSTMISFPYLPYLIERLLGLAWQLASSYLGQLLQGKGLALTSRKFHFFDGCYSSHGGRVCVAGRA
ncbi:hypothetical protein AAHA92_17140 [Salvia divinorum]|uniref:Uncharacterized protein n=1 Tax=Salvia divinorum TaxID=28513 RepID=A0ABD1GXS9_SALDI